MYTEQVGNYQRNKKVRKKERKKERKHALDDQESDQ